MASSDEGLDVPITSDPVSEQGNGGRHWMFPWMLHGHGPRFPPPFAFGDPHGMHGGPFHPPVDPRMDPRIYDPAFGMFGGFGGHGMHDFWGPRGFGDHHHGSPRFRPPHPGRPFPPRPFEPPPPPPSSSELDEHHHRCPYIQDWWQNAQTCPWIQRSTSAGKQNDKKDFKVTVNVSQFTPEDLNVTVVDGHVQIQGKHDEREDEHGFITREFIRRYQLPNDVDPGTVKSSLGQEGLLSVFAPRKQESSGEAHEVPIEIDPKSPAPDADDK